MSDKPQNTHRNDGSDRRRGMANDGALRTVITEGIRKGGINPPPQNFQRPAPPPPMKPQAPPAPKKD
jgi:hypothetical protein